MRRLCQHRAGTIDGFTKKYGVNRLIYFEEYCDLHAAILREKQLKGWRREKKIALIQSKNPAWVDLRTKWYQAVPLQQPNP
jgi:putative endonuclease